MPKAKKRARRRTRTTDRKHRPNAFLAAVDLVTAAAVAEAAETGEPFESVYERKWIGTMDELSRTSPETLRRIEADGDRAMAAAGLRVA